MSPRSFVLYQMSDPGRNDLLTLQAQAYALVLTTQPAGAVDSTTFTTQPVLQAVDRRGIAVTQAGFGVKVQVQTGSGVLSGTVTVLTNSSGVATFAGLSIAGTGAHTLRFSNPLLGTVDSGSFTVAAGGGGDPVPSGNIVQDTRAGGAQSWQSGGMTTIANLDSVWDEDIGHTLESFNTDVDGSGTNGRRSTWPASPGSEKDSQLNKYFTGSAPAIITGSNTNGWQIQFKRKLASDWAYNTNGQGGKVSLSLRSKDNGGDLNRIYMVENNAGYNFQIDNNGYFSGDFARSIALSRGVLETLTVFINPTGGIIQVTRNGVLEMNLSGQGIGSAGFSQVQFHVAYFIQNGCISDEWDYVINVP